MTSSWAEDTAERLDEAAEMIRAFDLGSSDEVAGLATSAEVLRRASAILGDEERASMSGPVSAA